jgi:type VI secretion system protein ImpE
MTASELFHAGKLSEAIATQIARVKSQPTDQAARLFLFELLVFTGDLDKARKQLDVLKYDDPRHSAAIEQYRNALESETKRRAVLAGTASPKWLTAVPEHVSLRLEAVHALANGHADKARTLLDSANASTPLIRGAVDGVEFHGLSDNDERFGTVLEVFGSGGTYAWIPLEQVSTLTMNPPASPRDILFRPAQLTLLDGVSGDILLPGLYPNSHLSNDEEVKIGRITDWTHDGSPVPCCIGGRVYIVGEGTRDFGSIQSLLIPTPEE